MRRNGNDPESHQLAEGSHPVADGGFWRWFDAEARPRLGQRADTFAAMFKHLDKIAGLVRIIETGCVRGFGDKSPGDNWEGDGCSTILFDRYVSMRPRGGQVFSVDVDQEAVARCKSMVSHRTHVRAGDSVVWLKEIAACNAPTADLIYLDSFDLDTTRPLASEVHHINELNAAMPMVGPDTLVVVDDSPVSISMFGEVAVSGKGALVARHAAEVGAELQFCHYQIGWTMMHRRDAPLEVMRSDGDLKRLVERARACAERSNDIGASTLYRLILALTTEPRTGVARVAHGEACLFHARASIVNGRLGTALDWYRRALAADPRAVEYRLEMATRVLRKMGDTKGGQREAMLATRIEPGNKDAWRILGGFEHDLDNMNNAMACYEKEMALDPEEPLAVLDMASIYLDVPDYDGATRMAKRVMELGREGDGLHILAFVAYREGRHEDAVDLYRQALAAGVEQEATVRWNMSLALHSLGRYREGWREHEHRVNERTQKALYMPLLRFSRPTWKGEPPPASIHVHMEAGAGDNLCCSRYLQMLVDRGYDVTYEAYEDMVTLMQRSFPSVKVVPQAVDYPGAIGIRPFDYHQPIGALPHVLDTEIDTVPWFGPYLHADPELAAKYRGKLPDGRKIGLCWSAGIREGLWISKYGARKSMHFDSLKPMLNINCPDEILHFVSLQVGPERRQNDGSYVDDVLPDQPSWDDTAALVANLDLVITVDTAVAHLAGAMGKPTWLMNSAEPGSWHWMAERPGSPWNERSPWYPSVKIYRQKKVGEWGGVIAAVARDLAG